MGIGRTYYSFVNQAVAPGIAPRAGVSRMPQFRS